MKSKYYYSPSKNQFYLAAIKDRYQSNGSWPADSIEVSDEIALEFVESERPDGKIIIACPDGMPKWADAPAPTPDQLANQARAERDTKLTATNWLVERHQEELETGATTLTAQEYADLLAYRQALRDVPQQAGFPETIDWPILPE